jgi:hypothetical protein
MLTPSERKKLDYTLLEKIGMSQSAVASLRLAGIITVGDCLMFFEFIKLPPGTTISMHREAGETLFEEVEPRLIDLGYLPKDWRDENVQI